MATESIGRFRGGDSAVGDERLFLYGSQPPLRTISGRDWLATGAVAAYAAKHAPLAAACPGLVALAMPAQIDLNTGQDGLNTILHNGTGYFHIVSGVSAGSVGAAYATTLAGLASGNLGAAVGLNRAYAAVVVDTTVTVVGGTSQGAMYFSGVPAWTNCNGSTSGESLVDIASKGTDAVAIRSGANSDGSSGSFHTTPDGVNFTAQSGSGGPSFTMQGIVWCPVASKYLIYGATQMNSSANGHSGQAACTLPAGVEFPTLLDRASASSAGVTLVKLTNNRLLRTTDGVAFTVVDFPIENMPAGTLRRIVYDGTRFIAQINHGGTAASAFLYSTTGATGTWTASPAFDDPTLPGAQNWVEVGMCMANSKWLLLAKQPSGNPEFCYDLSSIAWPLVPTRVGALKQRLDGDSQVYVRLT